MSEKPKTSPQIARQHLPIPRPPQLPQAAKESKTKTKKGRLNRHITTKLRNQLSSYHLPNPQHANGEQGGKGKKGKEDVAMHIFNSLWVDGCLHE